MARNPVTPARRLGDESGRRSFSFAFITDSFNELRRVTWPSREETSRLTVMVIAVSASVGLFLYVVDLVFQRLLGIVLGN